MAIVPHGFVTPQIRYPTPPPAPREVAQRTVSVIPDDFAIYNGRPRVPQIWCNASTLVVADGTYYTERDAVQDVNDDAYVSFVPLADYYDDITGVWTPVRDESVSRYRMEGNISAKPFIEDVEYRLGNERFAPDAMVVSPLATMSSNFNSGFDESFDFTLGMAFNLRTVDLDNNPFMTFGNGGWIGLNSAGLLANFGGATFGVTMPASMFMLKPVYLVLDVQEGFLRLMAGLASDKLYQGSTPISRTDAVSLVFNLQGELDVFSLDLWSGEAPPPAEIVARYASALGAHKTVGVY
jgi:hypothetical protein